MTDSYALPVRKSGGEILADTDSRESLTHDCCDSAIREAMMAGGWWQQ